MTKAETLRALADRVEIEFYDLRLPERFWTKVEIADDGCWRWTGTRTPRGYGQFHWSGRHRPAHRVAYETLVEPIHEGLVCDHLCRERACVNPAHIEPVTNRENIVRGEAGELIRKRFASRTHCANGHDYSPGNVITRQGRRRCVACEKAMIDRRTVKRRMLRAQAQEAGE